MAEVNVSPQDVKQAEALKAAISDRALAVDVCALWKKVKPFWAWIIKIVKLIPAIGGTIASALELLGTGLDAICKVNP